MLKQRQDLRLQIVLYLMINLFLFGQASCVKLFHKATLLKHFPEHASQTTSQASTPNRKTKTKIAHNKAKF